MLGGCVGVQANRATDREGPIQRKGYDSTHPRLGRVAHWFLWVAALAGQHHGEAVLIELIVKPVNQRPRGPDPFGCRPDLAKGEFGEPDSRCAARIGGKHRDIKVSDHNVEDGARDRLEADGLAVWEPGEHGEIDHASFSSCADLDLGDVAVGLHEWLNCVQ